MTPLSRPFPIAAEGAPGLVLRWAGPTLAAPDVDHLAVDLVNAGTDPWAAREGQHLLAVGLLRSAGEERDSFGFAHFASQRSAVPLGPGDYTRLPVPIGGGEWSRARPGRVLVDAVLPGIGLGTETPLAVELTAEDIELRRPETAPARRAPGAEVRRRLGTMSALLAARGRLDELTDAVLTAASDDEAVARIAAVLGCDVDDAGLVGRTGLLRFRSAERLEAEVAALRKRRADAES